MLRVLFRAGAVAILGALAAAILTVAAYAWAPHIVLSMDTEPAPIVRGLYPVEHDSRLTFAWTRERVTLDLPGLDRRHAWIFVLRFRGGRSDTASLPDVTIDVDGVPQATRRATNAFEELRVALPTSPGLARGARIDIRVSNTFVPGPGDARELGVVVDEIRLEPPEHGVPVVPMPALAAAALAGAIFGAAFALIALTTDGAVIAVVALTLGQAAALTKGAGPYAAWIDGLPWMAASIAVSLVAIVALVRRWPQSTAPAVVGSGAAVRDVQVRGIKLRNTALFAACFTAAVLYLKLLVLLHPDMPIGDGLFQAHRFEWVRAGRWLFTSVAPGLYQFPYAIGFYVFALPFATLVSDTLGIMAMLRIVAAVVDAVAGLLLYPALARTTGDRLAAAAAVALYHVVPLNFGVQAAGNLTNVFAQALFVVSIAIVLLGFRRRRLASAVVLAIVATAAMLSHTSTFVILLVVLVGAALALRFAGDDDAVSRAWPVLVATLISTMVAVGAYYGHFGATYAAEYARIVGELAEPAAPGAGSGVMLRAAMVPYYLSIYFGWPLLLLAAFGAMSLNAPRSTLAIVLWSWLGACALFLVLGIVTPVDLRHYLAAFPAVVVLASLGAARGWRSGAAARAATCALLVWAVAVGARNWLGTI